MVPELVRTGDVERLLVGRLGTHPEESDEPSPAAQIAEYIGRVAPMLMQAQAPVTPGMRWHDGVVEFDLVDGGVLIIPCGRIASIDLGPVLEHDGDLPARA